MSDRSSSSSGRSNRSLVPYDAWNSQFYDDISPWGPPPWTAMTQWRPEDWQLTPYQHHNGSFAQGHGGHVVPYSYPPPFPAEMHERMDQMKQGFDQNLQSRVTDFGDHYMVRLDVVEFDPADIRVSCRGKELTITGEHRDRPDRTGYVARKFMRQFVLPEHIISEAVVSDWTRDGYLHVTVPKSVRRAIKF